MKPASEGKSDLSRRTVYGYGLGEFSYSFYLNLISSYLMFYMTDVLLLPTKLTGILYSAVQWVEAATALAAGILIDNLFTSKGRYRPWIFRGSVICALSTALLFTRLPLGAAGTATVFVVLYTISYAGYNLMFVAYRAIMGAIGKTPSDTVALTISGTQLSTLASLAFGQIGVRLLHGFSRIETGYTVSAGLYGLILVITMAAVCAVTKPYDPGRAEAKKAEKASGVSPKQMLRALPPILPCAFGFIFSIGASTLLFSMLAYYFNWVIGDSAGMSTLITVMTVARLAATFVVTPLSRRFEKRTIFISSMLLSAVCITLAYVASKILQLYLFNVYAVYCYAALLNVIIAADKVLYCGFARARCSNERHTLPGFNREGYILEHPVLELINDIRFYCIRNPAEKPILIKRCLFLQWCFFPTWSKEYAFPKVRR